METPSDRLDTAIEERRLDLDLSLDDVATAAKISPAALRAIRRGTSQPKALTKRRLEDALKWARGSIDEVLAGRDPTPIEYESDAGELTAEERRLLAEIRRDPAKRERLLRAILAGHGHAPPSTEPDSDEHRGHRAS